MGSGRKGSTEKHKNTTNAQENYTKSQNSQKEHKSQTNISGFSTNFTRKTKKQDFRTLHQVCTENQKTKKQEKPKNNFQGLCEIRPSAGRVLTYCFFLFLFGSFVFLFFGFFWFTDFPYGFGGESRNIVLLIVFLLSVGLESLEILLLLGFFSSSTATKGRESARPQSTVL